MMKLCKKCNILKELKDFTNSPNRKDKVSFYWTKCNKKYLKEYYKNNKEKSQEWHKEYYKNNIDKIKKYRKDNKDKLKKIG